jgi:tetratricopeptide (TPR) repeat protein
VITTDKLPSCEERLGASAPKQVDPVRSSGYLKAARKHLMLGATEDAIQNLCLAGLSDPGGPASEGLAEYYLGQRAVEQAERWIRESLKVDPERRKSKELLGDIENQKGNVQEAKKILLATLQLSGDETKTMELTARKLRQDSRLARKGGDLPRAERELRRAALLSPKDAEIAAELGDMLLRREASVAAARWAAHSLTLDPNYSTAMLLSARIAEAQGKKDKAREFYEMIPLGDPNHDEAQRRRGRL